MRTLHGRMTRLEAKRGATPVSILSDAELEAEISWRRAVLAAEAERIASLPEHLRPILTAEDEALDRRIRDLEGKLAANGWRDLIRHVAEHGGRIFDPPAIIHASERDKMAEVESGAPSAGVAAN